MSSLVSGAMLDIYGTRSRIVVSFFWEARTLTPRKSHSGKLEIQSGLADFRWMVRLTAGKGMLP